MDIGYSGAGHGWERLGCLDSDPGMRPGGHIFVASKAEWFDITGDLPQYEEMVS